MVNANTKIYSAKLWQTKRPYQYLHQEHYAIAKFAIPTVTLRQYRLSPNNSHDLPAARHRQPSLTFEDILGVLHASQFLAQLDRILHTIKWRQITSQTVQRTTRESSADDYADQWNWIIYDAAMGSFTEMFKTLTIVQSKVYPLI